MQRAVYSLCTRLTYVINGYATLDASSRCAIRRSYQSVRSASSPSTRTSAHLTSADLQLRPLLHTASAENRTAQLAAQLMFTSWLADIFVPNKISVAPATVSPAYVIF